MVEGAVIVYGRQSVLVWSVYRVVGSEDVEDDQDKIRRRFDSRYVNLVQKNIRIEYAMLGK